MNTFSSQNKLKKKARKERVKKGYLETFQIFAFFFFFWLLRNGYVYMAHAVLYSEFVIFFHVVRKI